MLGDVDLHDIDTPEKDGASRAELAPHFEKVIFPTLRLGAGAYLAYSDAIISRSAARARVDPERLPTSRAYVRGPLPNMLALCEENRELEKQPA